MSERILWAIAALIVLWTVGGLWEEALAETPSLPWPIIISYSLLGFLTGIGLMRRVKMARHVASILLLFAALAGLFELFVWIVAAATTAPFEYALLAPCFIHGGMLIAYTAAFWWLTSKHGSEHFSGGR